MADAKVKEKTFLVELYITHTYVVRTRAKSPLDAAMNVRRNLRTASSSRPYWEGLPSVCSVAQHDEENLETRTGEVQEDEEEGK